MKDRSKLCPVHALTTQIIIHSCIACNEYRSLSKFNIIKYKNMSDYHNIVLILPSVISNDYFWHGSKLAYDTRHHDWSRGVLFSPWLVISHRRLLLARDYSWTVTPGWQPVPSALGWSSALHATAACDHSGVVILGGCCISFRCYRLPPTVLALRHKPLRAHSGEAGMLK